MEEKLKKMQEQAELISRLYRHTNQSYDNLNMKMGLINQGTLATLAYAMPLLRGL